MNTERKSMLNRAICEALEDRRLLASIHGQKWHDVNGNAISVNASGQTVPRLPFIELGEARFIAGFVGSYEDVKAFWPGGSWTSSGPGRS